MSLRLPAIISSHMVLQADQDVPVWGWASPGSTVTVTVLGCTKTATADTHGKWCVIIGPFAYHQHFKIDICDGVDTISVDDVVAGDVWLCAGQSNMVMQVSRLSNAKEITSQALDKKIRFFTAEYNACKDNAEDVRGQWRTCTPKEIYYFSAIAYFFSSYIRESIDIPLGAVVCAVDNSKIDQWLPRDILTQEPRCRDIVRYLDRPMVCPAEDTENTGEKRNWHLCDFDDSGWKGVLLPNSLSNIEFHINGAVWFRKKFHVAKEFFLFPGRWTCEIGPVNDYDDTYINGLCIGHTGKETLYSWSKLRRYRIPQDVLKPGENVIAVRVFNKWDDGGFIPESKCKMQLYKGPKHQKKCIDLSGKWRATVEKELPRRNMPNIQPCAFYYGMISPLQNFSLRGFLWYQGESDVSKYERYGFLFPRLISRWRHDWKQGCLPFYFVQLPRYNPHNNSTQLHYQWAHMREIQQRALSLPETGMAVALDCGESDNVHPDNKSDVAKRLSLLALNKVYGHEVEMSGPECINAYLVNNRICIDFSHADGLCFDGPADGFEIGDRSGSFYPARARIQETSIVVWNDVISNPSCVRYAWADDPPHPLRNSAGLPARPFRIPISW